MRGGKRNGAGRPAGAQNKVNAELGGRMALTQRLAEALGEEWCPVVEMARIAKDQTTPLGLRVKCLAEIAPYLEPRRKMIEGGGFLGIEALIAATHPTTNEARPPEPATPAPASAPASPPRVELSVAMPAATAPAPPAVMSQTPFRMRASTPDPDAPQWGGKIGNPRADQGDVEAADPLDRVPYSPF